MKQAAGRLYPGKWLCLAALFLPCGIAILGLAACSLSGPPPAEYALGPLPAATMTSIPQTGLPVIEIKRVQLPDYLDTTDILERRGNQLIPSSTGRWGERLSVGMTRAMIDSLAARLPRMVVTATPPAGRPARQILVDVAAFELRPDHEVVLVARWTITDGTTRQELTARQATLVEAIEGTGDSAVVSAMSHAIGDLAEQVAAGIERDRRPG